MHKFLLLIYLCCCLVQVYAHTPASNGIFVFVQNKGQLPESVLYSAELPQGKLFLESSGFTYNFLASPYFSEETGETVNYRSSQSFQGHALKLKFINANAQPMVTAVDKLPGYHNYIIGAEPNKWATEVSLYKEIRYSDLFQNTDLHVYASGDKLKYDLVVAPHGSVSAIGLMYEGAEQVVLKDGRLHIQTSVLEIIEEKPYAYQVINGVKKEVSCNFTLRQHIIGFEITGAYDPALPLVIDPELIFLTYSGANAGLSANCATADAAGNTYIASMTRSAPYPVTVGAYQTTRRGANIAISKFDEKGTKLLYATYLGGTGENEYPLAMVVNKQRELVLLGHTNSRDFPVTAQAFSRNYNGGLLDYFISKLSENGAVLTSSTYLGGNNLESGTIGGTPAQIALDASDDIYIVGCTMSSNFPIQNGFQRNLRAGYDGVISKLNSSLSSMLWSTFLGGSSDDLVFDIKVSSSGKVYVAGSTESFNFPVTNGVLHTALRGSKDGFISIISATGNQLLTSTYLGTEQSDLVKFVDLDDNEDVYAAGYTAGSYPITDGTYGTPGGLGGYFIHKLNTALSTTIFSTHLGSNTGERAPTAFRAQGCHNIYLAGYSLTTSPLTNDALERNRKTMYVCHLSGDGRQLIYGSYLGSNIFRNHVHLANTSLITTAGMLYQIECTYSTEHPTTQGAYDATHNGSTDAAVYKFKFSPIIIDDINAQVEVLPPSCAPYTVRFRNTTRNGTRFTWNFGDNSSGSAEATPVHTFQNPGTYVVRLIAANPGTCKVQDTTYVSVRVVAPPVQALPEEVAYSCSQSVTLDAGNPGYLYKWSTGATTQTIDVREAGSYEVEASFGDCRITQKVTVVDRLPPVLAPNIITPNGDGKNDSFRIQNSGANTKLKIFNRWGKLVYQSENYQNDWDGTNLSLGTYYYYIESPDNCTTSKGWVEIVK